MVAAGTLVTLVVAALASLFMAWTIGAGSSGSTPFAPAVGADAISVMRAAFVVGILGFAGAVLQGANVTQAIGNELVLNASLTATASTIGLLTAAILVAIGVFAGYPIATAFTVTGAVVGVGLALGGDPAWPKYRQIATLWVLVPFVGGGTAYATARALRAERTPLPVAVPFLGAIVGGIVANIGFTLLGSGSTSASVADVLGARLGLAPVGGVDPAPMLVTLAIAILASVALRVAIVRDSERGQRQFLLVLGGLVAFSAGGSQVGLAIGPLIPLLDQVTVPLPAVLVGGGLGLLVGSWTGAPRMIKALSQDYSSLGPLRSIAALIPSFVIAQTAVAFGIPVSFNEVIVSAIIGSGYAVGGADVSREKMVYTVLAWVASLSIALGGGYAAYAVLAPFVGG